MAMKWFTPDNTAGLDKDDLAIINRAARNLVNGGMSPTHRWLSAIRCEYRRGMSAADLIKIINDQRAEVRASHS